MSAQPIVPHLLKTAGVIASPCCAFCVFSHFQPSHRIDAAQGSCSVLKKTSIHTSFVCPSFKLSTKKVRIAFHEELALAILPEGGAQEALTYVEKDVEKD